MIPTVEVCHAWMYQCVGPLWSSLCPTQVLALWVPSLAHASRPSILSRWADASTAVCFDRTHSARGCSALAWRCGFALLETFTSPRGHAFAVSVMMCLYCRLQYGSRDPTSAKINEVLKRQAGTTADTIEASVAWADLVILAVPGVHLHAWHVHACMQSCQHASLAQAKRRCSFLPPSLASLLTRPCAGLDCK